LEYFNREQKAYQEQPDWQMLECAALFMPNEEDQEWPKPMASVYVPVCAREYWTDILPILDAGENRLFVPQGNWVVKWVLQQDTAQMHNFKATLDKTLKRLEQTS